MKPTYVVNYHYDDYDVLITRQTIFGNRHRLGPTASRAEVIASHFVDMQRRLPYEDGFHEAVMGLEGKRIACVCKPMDCHGDLYVEYIQAVHTIEAQSPGIERSALIRAALQIMRDKRNPKK